VSTVIAHLTDPHVRIDAPERRERVGRVVRYLLELPQLDAIVISGDLADNGLDEEYAQLKLELPTAVPTLVIPGNHDERAAFVHAFGATNSVLDVGGVRIVGLDSLADEGRSDPPGAGELSAQTLEFARQALASGGPTLVAVHHPPTPIGHAVMDRILLRDPGRLAAVLNNAPQVLGLLTGHVHTATFATFAGVPVLGAPPIAFVIEPQADDRLIASEAHPPGFALHTVHPGAQPELRTRFYTLP